ncbi:hypothetical protein [Ensifer aridi]|uniref:hypothetical protein n=1 Tax=Ensifer aridi TaxID=1708715 RepID=UPI000A11CC67|nr:hypothetical protein [Ensifer aridi]
MSEKLEILFDIRAHSVGFRAIMNGRDFDNLRGTPEGAQTALAIETAARNAGFRYLNNPEVRSFRNARPIRGDEVSRVEEAFARFGYKPMITGGNVADSKLAHEYRSSSPVLA